MVDLHTHTNASDGEISPSGLVERALKTGIKVLAITDHDTLDGIAEARERAKQLNINMVTGVEFSVPYKQGDFHLLGLGLTENLSELKQKLYNYKEHRYNRALAILEKARANGIEISEQDLPGQGKGYIVTRAHISRALIKLGVCKSVPEAFNRYLGQGKPLYVEKKTISLKETAELTHNSRGALVIAHPVSLKLNKDLFEQSLKSWTQQGVDGLEVVHPDIPEHLHNNLVRLCKKYNLVQTGGSDFHGDSYKKRKLGFTNKYLPIPQYYADNLLEWLQK